jgi:hypothetical protein
MITAHLLINDQVVRPLFTIHQLLGRLVRRSDECGPYVACLLGNRNPSVLYGWYILVSPEEMLLMKDYNWCGHVSSQGGKPTAINIRRRENLDGKEHSIPLTTEIWKRVHGAEPMGRVFKLGHPLDFRRPNLSLVAPVGLRGVTPHGGGFQVQLSVSGKCIYVGMATSYDEDYRMYNRHLRQLKDKNQNDLLIQSVPYNKVDPLF